MKNRTKHHYIFTYFCRFNNYNKRIIYPVIFDRRWYAKKRINKMAKWGYDEDFRLYEISEENLIEIIHNWKLEYLNEGELKPKYKVK